MGSDLLTRFQKQVPRWDPAPTGTNPLRSLHAEYWLLPSGAQYAWRTDANLVHALHVIYSSGSRHLDPTERSEGDSALDVLVPCQLGPWDSRLTWMTGYAERFSAVHNACVAHMPVLSDEQIEKLQRGIEAHVHRCLADWMRSGRSEAVVVSVGEQIDTIQRALSLGVSALARLVDVSRPTIYEWLNGKVEAPRNADAAQRLHRIYKVAQAWEAEECGAMGAYTQRSLEGGPSLVDRLAAGEPTESLVALVKKLAAALREARPERATSCQAPTAEAAALQGLKTQASLRRLRRGR